MPVKGKFFKKITVFLLTAASLLTLCACAPKNRRELMNYARRTYGDADLVGSHSNHGKDEILTVTMKDKATGIEYTVTSKMTDVYVDGSSFGRIEQTTSDFEEKYCEYLLEQAGSGLADLADEYGFTYELDYGIITITFADRESSNKAEEAVRRFADELKKSDVKQKMPSEYVIYAEGNVYIGYYDSEHDEYSASSEFDIIDYVHENYDAEAVFLDSMYSYIGQFLSDEEVNEKFPGHDGSPAGNAYYFKDKNGENFIVIDLKEFGADRSEIRLYRDTAGGMEEIDF